MYSKVKSFKWILNIIRNYISIKLTLKKPILLFICSCCSISVYTYIDTIVYIVCPIYRKDYLTSPLNIIEIAIILIKAQKTNSSFPSFVIKLSEGVEPCLSPINN